MATTTNLGRVSIVPRGAYNALTAYERQDLVTHENCTYLALTNSTGAPVSDTTKWLKIIPNMSVPVAVLQSDINAEEARAKGEEARIEALFTLPTQDAVNEWLDEHPEATTTVQDGSIDKQKLSSDLRETFAEATVTFLHQNEELCDDPTKGFSTSIVVHNSDTCVIYDFGADTSQRVNQYLADNNINKVNAVIISHYHSDHGSASAVSAFISGCETNEIDLSECVFYLPHKNIDWEEYVGDFKTSAQNTESSIIATLTSKGISYVYPDTDGQYVKINDIKIEFYNLDAALFDNYYSWYYNEYNINKNETNYNNFSMCVLMSIGRSKILLTGDIMDPAEEAMASLAKEADCLMVPHHGLNTRESMNFINNLHCSLAVLPVYWADRFKAVNNGLRPISSRCAAIGTLLTTLYTDISIDITVSGMYPQNEYVQTYRGEPTGQKLYPGENLNTIGYGVYYVDNAGESNAILNWPEGNGIRLGACKIDSFPGASGEGIVQTAREIYMQRMYTASRKLEGTWSAWQIGKPMAALDALSVADDVIPDGSDFNSYYAPGVSRVASDASATTMSNCPYAASGKLIRVARTTAAANGYTMQIYVPSSGAQHIYTRNYNAGSFTAWKEFAFMETGTWTPHLYDNETKVLEGPAQTYYKIGGMCFATYNITLSSALTISNVLQIRNLPFSFCWGGSFWSNSWGVGDETNVRTVQPVSSSAVFRPNIRETFASGSRLSGMLIGI